MYGTGRRSEWGVVVAGEQKVEWCQAVGLDEADIPRLCRPGRVVVARERTVQRLAALRDVRELRFPGTTSAGGRPTG